MFENILSPDMNVDRHELIQNRSWKTVICFDLRPPPVSQKCTIIQWLFMQAPPGKENVSSFLSPEPKFPVLENNRRSRDQQGGSVLFQKPAAGSMPNREAGLEVGELRPPECQLNQKI